MERERREGRCGDEGISTMEEERQFVGQSIVRVTFRGGGGRPPRRALAPLDFWKVNTSYISSPPYILETQFAPTSHIFCMQP